MRRTPFPSRSREADPHPETLATSSARSHAAHILSKLQLDLYPRADFALLTEVRNGTGMSFDVVRYADALAIHLTQPRDGWWIEGFELKLSRADFLRELRRPEKSGPLKLFCRAWWLVVVGPWKNILLSLDELPAGWGLIEIGTGGARIVRPAAVREAEQPLPGFLKALFRKAIEQRGDVEGEVAGAPLQPINRILDRWQVGLQCGHVALRPLTKGQPGRVPCEACRDGLPGDEKIVMAAIETASEEELDRIEAKIAERRGRPAPKCGCTNRDPVVCAEDAMERLGIPSAGQRLAPCPCPHCHPSATPIHH
jgi:hypothetical protein